MFEETIQLIHALFEDRPVPLHRPVFGDLDRKYVLDAIDSTFVSSVGEYVNRFEVSLAAYVGAKYAIATVNGTAALHLALRIAGVSMDDLVITQPMTFIATCNAISYCGAKPVFIDIDSDCFGLSPTALQIFIENETEIHDGQCLHRSTGRVVKACVPVHMYGLPCRIDKLRAICEAHHITLIEDAAEALGSRYHEKHLGTYGVMGIYSFNGNKITTSGGGGMIVTDDELLAKQAKHLSTTAKHYQGAYECHDVVGYNYRMPNINAALGLAQLQNIESMIKTKRNLSKRYQDHFKSVPCVDAVEELPGARWNGWINPIIFSQQDVKNQFIELCLENGIQAKPAWELIHQSKPYKEGLRGQLDNAEHIASRILAIPSSSNANEIKFNGADSTDTQLEVYDAA